MSEHKINFGNYKRLFGYALKYRMRLIIGIIAGLLSAGSFFGLLAFMPNAFEAFKVSENGGKISHTTFDRSYNMDDTEAAKAAAELVQNEVQSASNDADASATNLPNAKTHHRLVAENRKPAKPAMPGWFRKVERFAEKFGIPLRTSEDTLTWQALALGLMLLPVIVFARIFTSFLNHYCMRWVGAAVVRDLRSNLFATLQRQSLGYFGNCDIGQLISSCVNDTASVEHVVSSTIADAARAPFEIIAAIVFAIVFSIENGLGEFILVICLLLPLCLVPIVILGSRVKRWTRRSLERISFLVSRMHENFTGIRVIKAFNTETHENDRFNELNGNYFKAVVKALRAELLMSPLMEMTATILATGFIIACFIFHIRLSEILIIGVAVYSAYRPMRQLAQINAWLQRGAAALDRIFAILDTGTSLPEPASPAPKHDFKDRIAFDHVSFRFSHDGPLIVDDATFDVPRGSLVALVGETGSGKSTLANLLARFYDPTSGSVTLDGIPISQIATSDLRRLIGVVTQDTILFNDTIASNIAYGSPDATQADIENAARMANAHNFIVSHPEGYNRICGEKGFLLSGGEKQRIALARAILRNPPILILDEATSALDTVTEKLVQDAIAKVMAGRTTLAIAHRLSTIRAATNILVIEHGRIVESGTHDELYSRGGRYRHLCDIQGM